MHSRVSWEGNIWGRVDTPLCITSHWLEQCEAGALFTLRVAPCKLFLPPAISDAIVRDNTRSRFSIPFCIIGREMS
jgi:hypothetical protein